MQGNPGEGYSQTRHNIGFVVIDSFAKKHNLHFHNSINNSKNNNDMLTVKGRLKSNNNNNNNNNSNNSFILVKPLTYMNRSGIAVKQIMKQFEVLSLSIIDY